jgi:hypothetical protein
MITSDKNIALSEEAIRVEQKKVLDEKASEDDQESLG